MMKIKNNMMKKERSRAQKINCKSEETEQKMRTLKKEKLAAQRPMRVGYQCLSKSINNWAVCVN